MILVNLWQAALIIIQHETKIEYEHNLKQENGPKEAINNKNVKSVKMYQHKQSYTLHTCCWWK